MKFRLLSILLLCIPLVACGKTVHWKQEVLLQDGRVIVVERTSEQTGNIFPENISMEKSQHIEFLNPENNEKVIWDIPKGLKPFSLDFEGTLPYLVLNAYTVADYNNWNCPNPPYLVYRYQNGSWSSIPFEQLPEKIIKRNLVDMSKSYQRFSDNNFMSLDGHAKFLKDLPKNSRGISREKISAMAEGCDPDTLTKLGRQSEINYGR